ncbi:MAG: manganese efflux pump, partial [Atribacterota bacterium]
VSLATSIDAMAVGFSFALLHKGIFSSALVIGVVALMMTFIGVSFGHQVGKRFISKPEIVGGIAIIGIGLKVFLEHIV